MSNSQLEERQEREFVAWIASELNVSTDELTQHDFDVDENVGNDGIVYGHTVTFAEGTDVAFLAEIHGLQPGGWVNLGFPPDESEQDE